jgi:hypothetical protein
VTIGYVIRQVARFIEIVFGRLFWHYLFRSLLCCILYNMPLLTVAY